MSTLPQVAANDNQDVYTAALRGLATALRRAVNAKVAAKASFAAREATMLAVANEACLSELRAELQAAENALGDELLIDGVAHQRHQDGSAEYHSLCGTVRIDRATYRKVGERNGQTCIPLELVTGLIEGATPALALRVALGYAQGPGRHAEEQIHADHRRPPSRSTLERMGKAIGTRVKATAPRIEPLVRAVPLGPFAMPLHRSPLRSHSGLVLPSAGGLVLASGSARVPRCIARLRERTTGNSVNLQVKTP